MDLNEIRDSLLRDESIRDQIARRAYEIYSNRGYGGCEFEDWLQAEQEVLPYLIEQEQQRLAMERAALEPEIQGEEPVSAVEPAAKKKPAAKQSSAAKAPAAKSSASKAKSGKAPKKAAAAGKSAGKKTTKTAQP